MNSKKEETMNNKDRTDSKSQPDNERDQNPQKQVFKSDQKGPSHDTKKKL